MTENTSNTPPQNDGVMHALQKLPSKDMAAETAERVRRATAVAFAAERDLATRSGWMAWWTVFAMRTLRVGTPVLLAGSVGIYLTWAFGVAISLYQ